MVAKTLKSFVELSKPKITVPIAVTVALGYAMKSGTLSMNLWLTTFGLFLVACASAGLNHVQDRYIDAKMHRTQNRPLPQQTLSLPLALAFITLLFGIGSVMLYKGANVQALLVGWLALFWYNAIYTPLKRVTALAVIPGAVIGALPPLVGWLAAGGGWLDFPIIALSLFLFLWQIPHFWMLLVQKSADFKRAGLPTLTQIYTPKTIDRLILFGIVLMLGSALVLPITGVIKQLFIQVGVVGLSGFVAVYLSFKQFKGLLSFQIKKPFVLINVYAFLVWVGLFMDILFT